MGLESIEIFNDSQLVVLQIFKEYQAKEERMISYLQKVKFKLESFKKFTVWQIPKEQNALARLASTMSKENVSSILVKLLPKSSITVSEQEVLAIGQRYYWMDPIFTYLRDGSIPEDKNKVKTLKVKLT